MGGDSWLSATEGGVFIEIWAKPRSSKTRITGTHGDALSVALAAPPVDGEANAELVSFFSKLLSLPKSSVEIASGQSGRKKRVFAKGIEAPTAKKLIAVPD